MKVRKFSLRGIDLHITLKFSCIFWNSKSD